ncbi:response regulator transcription factor [Isobaculum melis]|uniref:Two-component system, OmpR family, response regulator VanR n=1 Tax=Isobaculum melis TaxID=142588 RepID=A0A1H9SW52_9LACT|nr:response regulator transcription factor [Isobaculum melis]SER89151.1 two-component system, OmpR family, response regulator VanR [Isobaculum melis]
MHKILFVDDNQHYLSFLKEALSLEGYQIKTATHAMAGIELFKKETFDLVISDLKMDVVDGISFLHLLRKINENTKVIILTSSESEEDEIKGLESNVNAYIQKDTSIKILLKRIEHTLNQTWVGETHSLSSKNDCIRIDTNARRVFKDEQEVLLTFKEYEMLVLFLKNRNIVLPREQIIATVWGEYKDFFDTRIVDTHVKKIRAKLRISRLYTVRGIGYEWVE